MIHQATHCVASTLFLTTRLTTDTATVAFSDKSTMVLTPIGSTSPQIGDDKHICVLFRVGAKRTNIGDVTLGLQHWALPSASSERQDFTLLQATFTSGSAVSLC